MQGARTTGSGPPTRALPTATALRSWTPGGCTLSPPPWELSEHDDQVPSRQGWHRGGAELPRDSKVQPPHMGSLGLKKTPFQTQTDDFSSKTILLVLNELLLVVCIASAESDHLGAEEGRGAPRRRGQGCYMGGWVVPPSQPGATEQSDTAPCPPAPPAPQPGPHLRTLMASSLSGRKKL